MRETISSCPGTYLPARCRPLVGGGVTRTPDKPMTMKRITIAALAVLGSALVVAWPTRLTEARAEKADAPTRAIRYSRDIQPILAANCFVCHGPDSRNRKARLRLDLRESATKKLRSGKHAIIPGNIEKSELIARIYSNDPETQMPPPDSKKKLTAEQKELLKQWIAAGAEYEQHWAFIPPRPVEPPKVKNEKWCKTPIDRFILARLEREGLTPSPEANRYILARRVAIDLTGLPPTPEMADRFVNDPRPGAYEHYVDELLKSPAFGERWAAVWLDLARYADSNGYAEDNPRVIWRYRDWVINAINQNMPFDRFTIEQIAGDLLPNPTEDQLIATAFHRNTPSNDEGGTDDEEFRVAAVVDRVNTTMQVWMGMTMGCAQCHDHKYDPLSQEEYYRLFAIFNQTEDSDKRDMRPTLVTYTEEQRQRRVALQKRIESLQARIAEIEASESKKASSLPPGELRGRFVRIEHLGQNAILSLAEVEVFSRKDNIARKGIARQSSVAYDGPAKLAIDGNTNGDYFAAKSTTHTNKENRPWWEVDLRGDYAIDSIRIWNRTDGNLESRLKPFRVVVLDAKRQPLWVRTIDKAPQPSVALALPKRAVDFSKADLAELARYRGAGTAAAAERKQLAELKKQLASIRGVPTPIMRELPKDRRRKTHIMIRGNFLDKGREVTPGVPAIFHPLPESKEINRLTLAKWLVDPKNPLTARVTVNRFWEQIFGRGLVETSEDFGIRGRLPTHPDLLDWLAIEFVREGWDVKKLLRLIVTSATYRQSSRVTPELLQADPDNRLYSRGPRFRVPAEVIRDQALFASGLLSRKLYGPPARPPRPNFGLRAAFGGSTDWKPSTGEDKYRRAVYTEWRRSVPYPSMVTFDAQNRNVCVIKRPVTNTPLQPLVTLNDPVYVEAAQALARRMVAEGGKTPAERAAYGFRLCLIRPPKKAEVDRLVALYEQVRSRYRNDRDAAELLATRPLGPLPKGSDPVEMAAWTVVGNVLLNLDEMFLKP